MKNTKIIYCQFSNTLLNPANNSISDRYCNAIYRETALGKEIEVLSQSDTNELSLDKSFYSAIQLKDNEYFYNSIFSLGLKILSNNN